MAEGDMEVPRSLQAWRGLINWLSFFFEILVQVLRGTPSLAQLLSYVGFRQSFLSPSSPRPSGSFRPLPVVEIQLQDDSSDLTDGLVGDAGDNVMIDSSDFSGMDKMTVVLDLDETLVCAYETLNLPEVLRAQAIEAGLKWFELECVSSDKECDGKPNINHVTVFERPGLREFLRKVGEFATLILFTAGLEDYARPLVDRIDVDKMISSRFYRPSTVSTKYGEHVKDLTCISKNLLRTVIVDNNPFSFLLQPLNGIPCVPFSAGQGQDDQLLEVLLPLLRQLSQEKDVRPVLYEKFHMPEWFQMHGIPAKASAL
ncbi:hypothetical protein MLD38_029961 [Melastoma candidum]|uniref:Uncharacterized protein n=1 Tax=Melastoma candidum TaxID=119954 RepID=A0ACB9MKE6_9MYRT|nr:hypothetical protein MLD38_029961 [Melastoma candidum]